MDKPHPHGRSRAGICKTLAIATSLASGAISPQAFAATDSVKSVDEPFRFKLYTASILDWVEGRRSGRVTDTRGRMASALFELIDSSSRKLDLAVYGVNKQKWVLHTLEDLVDRRVEVRAVVDQADGRRGEWVPPNFTYPDTSKLPRILEPGHVLPDLNANETPRSSTIMHHKYVVVDRRTVWLGSTNLSYTGIGAEYNANTSLVVESPELARYYTAEFQRMYQDHDFSIYKEDTATPRRLEFSDGTTVEVFFSPQDDAIANAVVPFIDDAEDHIDIGMFYLTSEPAAEALIRAEERGVQVRLINDALAAAHPSSQNDKLREAGVDVRVETWGGKMHMKTAVADGRHVLIGSMNWSHSGAHANDENTLVIRDNPDLAEDVSTYFAQLWASLDGHRVAAPFWGPRAEGPESVNSCSDGIDNDYDGMVDEADTACPSR